MSWFGPHNRPKKKTATNNNANLSQFLLLFSINIYFIFVVLTTQCEEHCRVKLGDPCIHYLRVKFKGQTHDEHRILDSAH